MQDYINSENIKRYQKLLGLLADEDNKHTKLKDWPNREARVR